MISDAVFSIMSHDFVSILARGGVGVMPTDTIYGLVGQALKPDTVERIYRLRGRDRGKPCIVLIGNLADLKKFKIELSSAEQATLVKVWPGQVSVILPCPHDELAYLHCGMKTLAFRLPDSERVKKILNETGPLVAPSANAQGSRPAKTIAEAKMYFADEVDFYDDGGVLNSLPSTLVSLQGGKLKVIRSGAVSVAGELLA